MIPALEALRSRQKVREIATKARADERTVKRVLRGEGPRNAAYERVVDAMASANIDQPPPMAFVKFGELGEQEVGFTGDGNTVGIYVLVDPRDQTVRYVGATESIAKRLTNHLSEKSNPEKLGWVEELRAVDQRPRILVIETAPRETAHLVEEKWIASYLEIGALYNQKDSGYQFRRQRRLSMERFRGKSFASLSSDEYFILGFSKVAKVRIAAVRNFLSGQEVWPKTYESIRKAADEIGVTDLPEPAERASRRPPPRPCPSCAAKDAEINELKQTMAGPLCPACGIIGMAMDGSCLGCRATAQERHRAFQAEVTTLRARVAELEADNGTLREAMDERARDYSVPRLTEAELDEVLGPVPAPVPPRPAPKPAESTSRVRIDLGDGVLLRASDVAGG